MSSLVRLMAAVERPGWRWDPWDGVLRHDQLGLRVSVGALTKRQVTGEQELQAALRGFEESRSGQRRVEQEE